MKWLPVILILPYLIILLKNYRSLLKIKQFIITENPSTFVSVVVACRNEEKNLPRLLNCLAQQDYPANLYEVIVVNDNSADETFKVASEFKSVNPTITLNNKGTGKKAALRTGIEYAGSNLIITTDADCVMGKNWIGTITSFYEKGKPDMIISPVRLEAVNGFFGRLQELEFMSLQGITAGFAMSGKPIMCNGANLAFKREAYFRHTTNLRDEINTGDDIFLLHSLKKEKGSVIKWIESADAAVKTKSSSHLRSFLKQRSRWISKSRYYTDKDTISVAVATFVAVLLQLTLFAALFANAALIPVFTAVFILKSIPDFLILQNTTKRYGKSLLMRWFLPAQLLYPFYVMIVLLFRKPKFKNLHRDTQRSTESQQTR
jgi:cellulose synthase/poly-beta-1,6-N-acetylglucosamine synthase-like glycosyltransferase